MTDHTVISEFKSHFFVDQRAVRGDDVGETGLLRVPEQLENIGSHQRFAACINQGAECTYRGNAVNQSFAFVGGQFIFARLIAYRMTMNTFQITRAGDFPYGMSR